MVQTAAQRNHYVANKEYYYERNRLRRLKFAEIIRQAKSVPCMDCGNEYPTVCMDFDHRDPTEKSFNIAKIGNITSERKLLEEIAKCDVVCSNCHRIRTWPLAPLV